MEGGFEEFLLDEFFHSYPNIKEKFPEKAFDRLCYLLGKTMTRKAEIKTTFKGEVKTETNINILLQKYEAIIERATNRNLQENNSRKPIHTTHTNT